MTIELSDYLLDAEGVDWPSGLRAWHWLLPEEFDIWFVNRFCELFLVPPDGAVYKLDVGCGELQKLTDSRDDMIRRFDDEDNANDWLLIPLVDELVAAGKTLGTGMCYGFKVSPILESGSFELGNCAVLPILDYLGGMGTLHEQLASVPDGHKVVIRPINVPRKSDD
jgi:hypothetical protein